MTVKVSKPAINVREELADLRKPTGIAGEAMLRAETPQEQFNLIGAGRRNLIINGGMQVAQRGTSSSTGTSNTYSTVDRMKHNTSLPSGVSTLTYSQDTDAPDGFGYSYKVTPDQSATAALTGGNRSIAMTIIEAQDLQQLAFGSSDAKPFTVSFWIKSNLTGTFTLELESPDSGSSYLFFTKALTINTSGVWEYKTVTIPPHVNGTMNNDNDVGLVVAFWLAAGPTFTSGGNPSDGSWHSSTNANRADPSNINIYSSSSNYVQITGVQLELGKVATPFEHRSYGEELALCQRYYFRLQADGALSLFYTMGQGYTSNGVFGAYSFPVEMRTRPTALEQTGTASDYFIDNGSGTSAACTSVPTFGSSTNKYAASIVYTSTGNSAAGAARGMYINTNGYLGWSAEL
jgi:hypothetical protein